MYRNGYETYFGDDRFEQHNLLLALWMAVSSTVCVWWQIRKLRAEILQERKVLATLSDHTLRDIGINRTTATAESNRGGDDLPLERLKQLDC